MTKQGPSYQLTKKTKGQETRNGHAQNVEFSGSSSVLEIFKLVQQPPSQNNVNKLTELLEAEKAKSFELSGTT